MCSSTLPLYTEQNTDSHNQPNSVTVCIHVRSILTSLFHGQVVWSAGAGGMDRPSSTKSHLAGSLTSSQPGGPPCWTIPLAFGIIGNHRGDKGRGEKGGVFLPSQLERTPQLGLFVMITLSPPPAAVSKLDFYIGIETKIPLSCYGDWTNL